MCLYQKRLRLSWEVDESKPLVCGGAIMDRATLAAYAAQFDLDI